MYGLAKLKCQCAITEDLILVCFSPSLFSAFEQRWRTGPSVAHGPALLLARTARTPRCGHSRHSSCAQERAGRRPFTELTSFSVPRGRHRGLHTQLLQMPRQLLSEAGVKPRSTLNHNPRGSALSFLYFLFFINQGSLQGLSEKCDKAVSLLHLLVTQLP